MADLYSILPGIQPDQQEVVEAEFLSKQILEANFPDLDLRDGTAARDLAIRPGAFLLALCKKAFDYYFAQNTLSNVTDATDPAVPDEILSNMFVTRNLGTYAVISARLYFSVQKSATLTTSTSFSTDGVLMYYPAANLGIQGTDMTYDTYEEEWYVDVDLQAAATGESYNLSSGSLLYFSNFDPFFLHAEINYLKSTSIGAESNSQFISRAGANVSTRNLINQPSIDSKIRGDFNYVTRVTSIGSGNPYVYRDQVLIKGATPWTQLSTSATMVDTDTHLQLVISNHGLIVNQLVDVIQLSTGLQMRACPVYSVVDANTFLLVPTVSGLTGAQNNFWVTPTEPDIYIHNAGSVDVHIGDATYVTQEQLTFDDNGYATLGGPVYKIVRLPGETDTADPNAVFTTMCQSVTNPIYLTMGGVTFAQDVNNVLTCTTPVGHCMAIGRIVKINDWPTPGTKMYLPVQTIQDAYNFTLGFDLPAYVPGPGLSPSITYVNPPLDVGFSMNQLTQISGGGNYADKLATFEVHRIDKVEAVDSYLRLSTNRVVTGDLLARGYDLYVLNMNLVTYNDTAPTSGAVASVLTPYLASIQAGQTLILSDLMAKLNDGGITGLKNPPDVTAEFHCKELFGVVDGPVVSTVVDTIKPLTPISLYVLGDITISTAV